MMRCSVDVVFINYSFKSVVQIFEMRTKPEGTAD